MVDAALQQLFSNNGLSDAQVTYLASKGITSVIKLGNMFDTREKVSEFVAGFEQPVHRDSSDLLAFLKQSWREATVTAQTVAEAGGSNTLEDDYKSLPPPVARKIALDFFHKHHFNFTPGALFQDSHLGRIRREIEKRQPTLADLARSKR